VSSAHVPEAQGVHERGFRAAHVLTPGCPCSEEQLQAEQIRPQLEGSRGYDVCTGACHGHAGTQLLCLRAGALLAGTAPGASAAEPAARAAGSTRAATRLQGDKDAIACVHLQPGHALPWPRQQLRAPREGRRWGLRLLQARAPHMLRGQA
jgi:hypothetical protein